MSRTECSGKRLAVHARQRTLQPGVPQPRRHHSPMQRPMEPPHRSAMAHHVHRKTRSGTSVPINGSWYKSAKSGVPERSCRWRAIFGLLGAEPVNRSARQTPGNQPLRATGSRSKSATYIASGGGSATGFERSLGVGTKVATAPSLPLPIRQSRAWASTVASQGQRSLFPRSPHEYRSFVGGLIVPEAYWTLRLTVPDIKPVGQIRPAPRCSPAARVR